MGQLTVRLAQYWNTIQSTLFPWLEEQLDPLTEKQQQLVAILEFVRIESFLPDLRGFEGRPQKTRSAIARSFVAKMVYNLNTTTFLIDRLKTDKNLRRICGWESLAQLPSESTFSRAFADFASTELPQRVHDALIKKAFDGEVIFHNSRDSTAIDAREKGLRKAKPEQPVEEKKGEISSASKSETSEHPNIAQEGQAESQKKEAPIPVEAAHSAAAKKNKKKMGRPKKGEERPAPEPKRIEKQKTQSLEEMLNDLPKACDKGGKQDSKGNAMWWNGYKLHWDVTDGGIPISVILTSASVHDSQVAIPLATMTARKVINLYDLMDSAYDVPAIIEHSKGLGHVPIIAKNPRRDKELKDLIESNEKASKTLNWSPAEKMRYNARTTVERANSRLKDEFGACKVRVRGHVKVACHLMFGVLVLAADQLLNLVR